MNWESAFGVQSWTSCAHLCNSFVSVSLSISRTMRYPFALKKATCSKDNIIMWCNVNKRYVTWVRRTYTASQLFFNAQLFVPFSSSSLLTLNVAILHPEVPRQASISITGMKPILPGIFRPISPTMRNLWLYGLPHQATNTECGPHRNASRWIKTYSRRTWLALPVDRHSKRCLGMLQHQQNSKKWVSWIG